MSVTQYIGARYVPLFADPITWDITQQYEPLTVVCYQGNSYTSKQSVPANIDISNTDYWVLTGNYNAQIEQYRAEVQTFDNRITANTTSNTAQDAQLAGTTSSGLKTLIEANASDISTNSADISEIETTLTGFSSSSQVKTYVDDMATDFNSDLSNLETSLTADIDEVSADVTEKHELIFIGDSWATNFSGALPTQLGRRLNCTVHSYAVSGTSFIQGDSNFVAQANAAVVDTTVNASRVKYIVILGGSNDWSHGNTSDATLAQYINQAATILLAKFKRATIHVAFNIRWKYNDTVWSKLNGQIRVWDRVTQQCGYNNYPVICHPESMCWLSKTFFQDDLVHPTEIATRYFAQYLAMAISGGQMSIDRTNRTSISLNGYSNVNGYCYVFFNEQGLRLEFEVNVTTEFQGSHGIATDANGLSPVQLYHEPSVNQETNQLGAILARVDGQGSCNAIFKFTTSNLGDTIYISPTIAGGTVPVGVYKGSVDFRFYGI